MSNCYATRAEVKVYLGIATTDTDDDALLEALCERVSRFIDSPSITDQFFYELSDTRYFDYTDPYRIDLDVPLISATTVMNDDSAVSSSDYRLMPRNTSPKWTIDIIRGSGEHLSYSDTPQDASNIEGLWGYHDDPDNRWAASDDTVQNTTQIAADGTTLTVSDGDNFQVGQTVKIDDEQLYLSASSGANGFTVDRAENGTTAATHANGTIIYIYRPMAVIREAARELVCQLYKMKDSVPWGRIEMIDIGMIQVQSGVPELAQQMLRQYRRLVI